MSPNTRTTKIKYMLLKTEQELLVTCINTPDGFCYRGIDGNEYNDIMFIPEMYGFLGRPVLVEYSKADTPPATDIDTTEDSDRPKLEKTFPRFKKDNNRGYWKYADYMGAKEVTKEDNPEYFL